MDAIMEIPPRARRRALVVVAVTGWCGNTSACAEKRVHRGGLGTGTRKYLRVRGEEPVLSATSSPHWEIPPRARRRVKIAIPAIPVWGNTSACAEKRRILFLAPLIFWKYLRVRGEEMVFSRRSRRRAEIPPRARRRASAPQISVIAIGNTSACAEKRLPEQQL